MEVRSVFSNVLFNAEIKYLLLKNRDMQPLTISVIFLIDKIYLKSDYDVREGCKGQHDLL